MRRSRAPAGVSQPAGKPRAPLPSHLPRTRRRPSGVEGGRMSLLTGEPHHRRAPCHGHARPHLSGSLRQPSRALGICFLSTSGSENERRPILIRFSLVKAELRGKISRNAPRKPHRAPPAKGFSGTRRGAQFSTISFGSSRALTPPAQAGHRCPPSPAFPVPSHPTWRHRHTWGTRAPRERWSRHVAAQQVTAL